MFAKYQEEAVKMTRSFSVDVEAELSACYVVIERALEVVANGI